MDPLVWTLIFGLPLMCAAHAWLYAYTSHYPSDAEINVFQSLVVFFLVFVVVWRILHPIPYFWTVANILVVLNIAWVPLTHSAVAQVRKTILWTLVVFAIPCTLLGASIFLIVTPSNNVGDNLCMSCVAVATTCAFVHAYLVYMSIRTTDAYFSLSPSS